MGWELFNGKHHTSEVLMSHGNASLTPTGRLRLARCIVDDRWPLRRAADRFGVSVTTARRWAGRYREHGKNGTGDRSSRPRRCPRQLQRRTERRIIGLRVSRRWGPARIAYRLRLNPATVHKVLVRYQAPRLAWTDPATGARLRAKPKAQRYEHAAPGDLIHVDVKKLGRIPDGGGHRIHGRAKGNRINKGAKPGTAFIHNAIDDHSRLAYCEIRTDERKETASGFWTRANAYFNAAGITVQRVLTDNGSAYRSKTFAQALGDVRHKRTRPYRPQTNGKVERFNRTLEQEWAYALAYASEAERVAAFPQFLHTYNHHRGHTALKAAPHQPTAYPTSWRQHLASPNLLIQEQSLGIHYNAGSDLLDYLLDRSVFDYSDGYVGRLTGPGLGIDVDADEVERAADRGEHWHTPLCRRDDGSFAEW